MNTGRSIWRLHPSGLLTLVLATIVVGCTSTAPTGPTHRAVDSPLPIDRNFLSPCTEPGDPPEALCGTYEVYENRSAQRGRKIGLKVVVVPATGNAPVTEAITYFEGGPGGASTPAAGFLAQLYEPVRENRDVFIVDFRGTGGSEELRCPYQDESIGFAADFLPTAGVAECWQQYSKDRDLSHYTTGQAIDDVDEVRQALGYQKIHILGGSYGTRAGLIYMRRHPDSVATVNLAGPVPNDAEMPSTFARDAQSAFDGWVQECAEDPDCAQAFPDPQADLSTVLAQVDKSPPKVEVRDPRTGEMTTLELQRSTVVQTIRYMDYQSGTALRVPLLLHEAAKGNWHPIAEMAVFFYQALSGGIAEGFYLSVSCAEDVPFFDLAEATAAARGTYLGAYRAQQQKAGCSEWPVKPVPRSFHQPVRSAKPVLVVVGERDPVTPPRWAHEVAQTLSGSRTMVIPDGGHGFGALENAECVDRLGVELVQSGAVEGLDIDGCLASIRRPPFETALVVDDVIDLSSEQRAAVIGTYRVPSFGMVFEIKQVGDELTLEAPGMPPGQVVGLADGRFKVIGLGPGIYIRFDDGDSGMVRGEIDFGGLGGKTNFERAEGRSEIPD